MSFNDALERALAQAREVQRQISEAASGAAEQAKPHIQKSLDDAKELQATLSKHAEESGDLAAKQAQTTLGHLSDFIRLGTEALRESAEQTRATTAKLVEQSRKVVEAAAAGATGKGPN